jgi:hypothetical protein
LNIDGWIESFVVHTLKLRRRALRSDVGHSDGLG